MELQWPLILFTTFVAASAGLFGTQGVYVLAGRGQKVQMRATVVALVLLVIGGIAVFFHLTHPERLFNGFGHITSGITQELIAIVCIGIMMLVFLVYARKGDVPKWAGAVALVLGIVLVCVMGHSYVVASRPAWNSILQITSLLGGACAMGVGIFAALDATEEADFELHGISNITGTAIGAVFTIAYVVSMASSVGLFTNVGAYFDPTQPTTEALNAATLSPFAGASLVLTIGAIVLTLVALGLAIWGRKANKWQIIGWTVFACSFVAAILLRVVFYDAGGSIFLFY